MPLLTSTLKTTTLIPGLGQHFSGFGTGFGDPLWDTAGAVPSLDVYFSADKSLRDRISGQNLITFGRAGGTATYVNATGTIVSAAANEPRFTHDPVTLRSLGLLVEESRTNYIRNNTMVGAVAGTPGSPPTGWTFANSANGIDRSITGIGVENGITYIEVRFSGLSTASGGFQILPQLTTDIAAVSGQTWTASYYLKLQAGSLANLTSLQSSLVERSSAGGLLVSTAVNLAPTSAALGTQRIEFSRTLNNASTAFVSLTAITAQYASGVPIECTLRIGFPQLEQGATASSVIPTTGTQATRNADVATITGAAFSSWYRQDEGSLYVNGAGVSNISGATRRYAEMTSLTAGSSERILLGYSLVTNNRLLVVDNNVSVADVSVTGSSSAQVAAAFKVNSFQLASNGTLGTEDTNGSLPAVDTLYLGSADGSSPATFLNGTISRLTYFPQRLPNAKLQAITA